MIFKILKNFFCRLYRHLKVKTNRIFAKRHTRQAKKLTEILLKQKEPNTALFIAGPGMGDVLYGAAFLHEFKRQNSNIKMIIITPPHFVWIFESFEPSYDKIVKMQGKYKKFCYLFDNEENLDLCFEHKILTTRTVVDISSEQRSAMEQLKNRIFKVGSDAIPQLHSFKADKVTSIPNFEKNCRNIIILNPFSPSCHLGKQEIIYFERIAQLLQAKGYIVYTNVVRDRLPIKNTLELRCSLKEMLGIAEKIPFIVSIRSGLLDFIVKTDINMFVIYSEHGVIRRDIYSLKDWGCGGNITEVTYDDIHRDNDLNIFKHFMKTTQL